MIYKRNTLSLLNNQINQNVLTIEYILTLVAFSARPLPSSGLMAVLQSFCDGGVKDEDGFDTFPNST